MTISQSGRGRSVLAVVAGVLATFILSLGTDQVLHSTGVYPPWGERMADDLFIVALAYRLVYGVVAGYVTARLAPWYPMQHALVLGVIGTVLGLVGAIGSAGRDLGPSWYTYGLALSSIPTVWLGAMLYQRRSGAIAGAA